MNIVQYHHSCEVSSSKIRQFFAEFHVSQFLRNYKCLQDVRLCGHDRKAASEAVFQRRSFYQRKKDASESIPFERDMFYHFNELLDTTNIQKVNRTNDGRRP